MFKRLLIALLFPFAVLAQYNVQTLNSSTFMNLQTKHNYQTYFNITLVGNVSSVSIDNAPAGSKADFNLCQDVTGGRTWVWPSTFTGTSSITVSTTASACTQASFISWTPSNAFACTAGAFPTLSVSDGTVTATTSVNDTSASGTVTHTFPNTTASVLNPAGTIGTIITIKVVTTGTCGTAPTNTQVNVWWQATAPGV